MTELAKLGRESAAMRLGASGVSGLPGLAWMRSVNSAPSASGDD